jgi:hypothetical protein
LVESRPLQTVSHSAGDGVIDWQALREDEAEPDALTLRILLVRGKTIGHTHTLQQVKKTSGHPVAGRFPLVKAS